MKLEKVFDINHRTMDCFEDMLKEEPMMVIPLLCTCIDRVAEMTGKKSIDLVDKIRPMIASVNEQFEAEEKEEDFGDIDDILKMLF